ncbi:hypothetical protein ACQPZP_31175 [Spirillospora sp. CA-142024]|uniref:hypothetical protein n=1 Tax=Spirillospora sp. CA-142024 TaxID=3240036 RepID=UPI003D8FED08
MRSESGIPAHVGDSSVVFDGPEEKYIEDADQPVAGAGAGEGTETVIGLHGEAQRLVDSE